MVTVELLKDQNESIVAFRVEGHTGFDDQGQDIVCAGVSAITQTALIGLMTYLEKKPVYNIADGILACSLAPGMGPEDGLKAKVILGTMEAGLKEIEFRYDDFIELTIRRC